MLGAAGALLCMALGTALGAGLKERLCARLRLLENEMELLARMRLLILEERLGRNNKISVTHRSTKFSFSFSFPPFPF